MEDNTHYNECVMQSLKIEELERENKLYKKAYTLLAKAYCDKGYCWVNCECRDLCSVQLRYGVDITKEHFLEKAREEE